MIARRDAALDVRVLDAPEAAAYCMPGRRGHVLITTGALAALSRTELAAVLGP